MIMDDMRYYFLALESVLIAMGIIYICFKISKWNYKIYINCRLNYNSKPLLYPGDTKGRDCTRNKRKVRNANEARFVSNPKCSELHPSTPFITNHPHRQLWLQGWCVTLSAMTCLPTPITTTRERYWRLIYDSEFFKNIYLVQLRMITFQVN